MEALSLRCCAASTSVPLYSRNPRLSVALSGQRTANLVHTVAKTTDAESCNGVRSNQGLPDSEGSSKQKRQVKEGLSSIAAGALLGIAVGTLAVSAPTALANFLSYDHAEMRGANLSQQDLRGAVFAACDCRQINLQGSNLDNTTDTFAGFQGANLKNTSWVRALADRVVFRSSNLQNANFTNAILSGSQFEDADITGADFTEAILDKFQRLKMCKKATGVNPVTGVETRESLFC